MSLVYKKERVGLARQQAETSVLQEKATVEARAVSRLRRSPYPEVHRVTCEFHEGMLCLHGRVPSYYLKQIAQTAILGMDGVDEIRNQLEVVT